MSDEIKYIPLSECVLGGVYRIHSRNLSHGVYDGREGFIGIRKKFKDRFLFTEYHWDQGPPYGTVKPLEKIAMLDPNMARECLGSFAVNPETGVEEEVNRRNLKPGEAPHGSRHGFVDVWAKDGTRLPDTLWPYRKSNKELFNYLDGIKQDDTA